ncbi:uncharacterized protein [Aegilops tauschii subsp. strangulata]|uniref:uncharacterized protein isoform X3 n=1 Tax=Aegilops tauschii subsp. strangulata TaxID=200361 RepID=UPI001ABC0E60|nr:uncharacterized protein LOC109743010 isoform X2 [Aegilops tauschii subsp. strangulata]
MASRAIIRRRKRLLDNVNAPILSSSFSTFQHGAFGFNAQPRIAPQFLEQSLGDSKSDKEKEQYNVNLTKGGLLGLGNGFPQRPAHVISLHGYGIGRSNEFALPFGARGLLQSVRRASTATAGQPELDIEEEQSEDQKQNKKKKEASPEECDQAVEGLSTAKAKAKAKQVQESLKASRSIVQKFWARLLGIGPALRAIASMSRVDWAVKLKHGKDEFISRLQHYWLGTKLLWADVRISSRLLVKLAGGKSLSRRERQQLTRTTADIFRLVPVAVFIVVPFMEFLLPVFLKLFPNMLPSTFQDKMKEEEALKRKLKARMEYAKFLQEPAKEMAKEVKASYSGETKQTAGDLDEFLNKDVTNVGDEGGFAPNIQENKDGLELLKTAIEKAGYTGKVVIGMDVAASEFYNDKDKTYDLNFKEEISGDSLKNVYKSFVSEYPIGLIKDPVEQDDWMHYAKMTEECGESLDYDHLVNKQMDHVLKASSQDKPGMTLNRIKVFQNGRTFSSIGLEPEQEVSVVKQLMSY